jgi:putative photosynthetic complex assembly protein 2
MGAQSTASRVRPARAALAAVDPAEPSRPPRHARTLFRRAAIVVVGFWWLSTGLVVALQRTGAEAAMATACIAAACGGAWLVVRAAGRVTAQAVRMSFVGAALLWAALQAAFYAGWIVGPMPLDGPTPAPRTIALALDALRTTSHADAAALLLIAGVALASRRAAQPTALHALLAFWATHQLARLCLFLGVANPATRFLPEGLRYLARYFGPSRNSLLLFLLTALVAAVAWRLGRSAVRASAECARERLALLAVLAVLGVLELLFLAMPVAVPLWDVFLRVRGQG